jgi:hypothetical protein
MNQIPCTSLEVNNPNATLMHFHALSRPAPLVPYSGIVQRNTDRATVMAIVLSDDALAVELPQPCIVI